MGGCRCYFRDCHANSEKHHGLHFFRFPLKEAERLKKWCRYCQLEKMFEFPEVRRKNISVCGRHFRPECFMNYKMDRLIASAVPTIFRLSVDKALDFELDIENGVLVDLEKPKAKHIIPPDGFKCPLYLTNDTILLEKLNFLQSQQYNTIEPVKYIEEEPEESEDIHVRPIYKRPREKCDEEKAEHSKNSRNEKRRILNTSNCVRGNDVSKFSTVVLALDDGNINSNEINIVEAVQIKNQTELSNNEEQLFLTSQSFSYDCDENLEFVQVHKNQDGLHNELHVNDSDAPIEQIELQIHSNEPESENVEIINVQQSLLEYDLLKQDYGTLLNKCSLLETENKELKKDCQHIEEIKRNLLTLQLENDNLKKSLKNLNESKVKLNQYSEENKKLRSETANMETLKSELLSRKEETKELKRLLATLTNVNSKKLHVELEIKNKEINGLIKKFELSQQQLNDTLSELEEVQNQLNDMKNDNKRLSQNEQELKKTLSNTQSNYDSKHNDYNALKFDFDNLQQKQSCLEQKYWKLQALQNQESTVSTSLGENNTVSNLAVQVAPAISASSLTKAQLFNGIKRYLSASMVSLLRMEMFGSSEREWKTDERQVAVDILRLGEIVYKYFTDEWRIRLPALRDVRNWLSQSQQLMDDEEDL